jgi:hypothetical protein
MKEDNTDEVDMLKWANTYAHEHGWALIPMKNSLPR